MIRSLPQRSHLLVAVALTAGCSRGAPPPSVLRSGDRGAIAASPRGTPARHVDAAPVHQDAERRDLPPAPDPVEPRGEGPSRRAPAKRREVRPPGIALDPTFSTACRLPPTPKAFFAVDSAELDADAVELLRVVAACLTQGPLRGYQILLIGFADPRGPADHNEVLARARAESVRSFLRDEGVSAKDMLVRVRGEGLGDPLWPPGWDFDRRVEIRLVRPAQ